MTRPTFATILVLLASLAGCGGRERDLGPGASARDSAGVELVRSTAPAWGVDSAWRIGDTALVVIGGGNGVQVGRVADVVRTGSGAIAVADGEVQVVRVYDLSGRLLRTLGRRGTGAGEFQAIDWLAPAADSILAFDLVARRLTMFGAPTRVRIASLAGAEGTITAPLGRYADGTLLVAAGDPTFPFQGDEGSVRNDSVTLIRSSAEGEAIDTIARVAWGESFGVAIGEGDRRFLAPMPRPFGPRASAAVVGDVVVVGEAKRHELKVFGAGGALVRSIRRDRDPLPVTPDAIAAFKEAQRRGSAERGLQAEVDAALLAALEQAPWPERLPAFDRVLADPDGNLWVLDYGVRRDQPGSWNVFTAEGRWLGTVETPARFRVEQVGRDWILGVGQGPGAEEEVRMYRIVRP
jgi:hypothetical protein